MTLRTDTFQWKKTAITVQEPNGFAVGERDYIRRTLLNMLYKDVPIDEIPGSFWSRYTTVAILLTQTAAIAGDDVPKLFIAPISERVIQEAYNGIAELPEALIEAWLNAAVRVKASPVDELEDVTNPES